MPDLSHLLRKRLAQKFLGKQAIGAVVMSALQKQFPEYGLDGYVSFDTLILRIPHPYHKMEIFRRKNDVIEIANASLEKIGYEMKIVKCMVR